MLIHTLWERKKKKKKCPRGWHKIPCTYMRPHSEFIHENHRFSGGIHYANDDDDDDDF